MSKFIPNMGITETETELPGYINLVDRKTKQRGGYESETSSELSLTSSQSEMVGGGYSQTSEMFGGGKKHRNTYSETSDYMVGGKKNNYSETSDSMVGGGYSQTSEMFGGSLSKKNTYSTTSSEMVGGGYSQTSEMVGGKKHRNTYSVTSSEMVGGGYSQTSEMVGGGYSQTSEMVGGGYSQTSEMVGGGYSQTSEMVGGGYSQTSEMVGGKKHRNTYSVTSSDMVGGAYSQTSSMRGGNGLSSTSSMVGGRGYSATSSMKGGNGMSVTSDYRPGQSNVNELVSMLTSESDASQSNTNTEELENQLKNILKGGKSKSKHVGTDSKNLDMTGGNNPGFKAFLDLKKYVAEQLKVSNGPKAAKVAGAVQRETKEKNPNVTDGVEIAKLARKAFDAHKKKYEKMLH